MTVKLKEINSDYPKLSFDQHYLVIGIEADDLRLLNNQGKPYLYPQKLFDVVDSKEPNDWLSEYGEDRERYAYPPLLNTRGFFEDFFDFKEEAIATFWQVINQHLIATPSYNDPVAMGQTDFR